MEGDDGNAYDSSSMLPEEMNAFGKEWSRKFKGDAKALPSIDELVKGLSDWYIDQINSKIVGKTRSE